MVAPIIIRELAPAELARRRVFVRRPDGGRLGGLVPLHEFGVRGLDGAEPGRRVASPPPEVAFRRVIPRHATRGEPLAPHKIQVRQERRPSLVTLRVTLVKTEVGKAWKRLSSSESSENSMLRLNNAPDGNVKEKGIVIINNNNSNNINLRDLRAEVIKFRDGNLAPKFTPSKTPEEIENELDAQINDVSTPMEFASLKEAMQSCDHFESSGDHANAIKSFSSALFFLRFFTSSSSPPASEDGSEDTTTLEEGGKSTSTTTMEVKIMDCLRRRAKANVLLGKTRNATKDYAEAIQEGKKLLSSLSSSSNATSSAINDKDADATKKILSDLYFERGNAYEQVEKYAEAVDDYKRALKTGGNDTKVSMALTRASKLHFQRDIERKEIEKKRPKNDNENSLPSLPRPGMKQFENRGKAGACF
mgnify:CR=1 FL=1